VRGGFWRVIRKTEAAGEIVATLALWGIVVLIFFQVFFRYVLQTGLSWPDELARYFHIVVVFLTWAPFPAASSTSGSISSGARCRAAR